MKKILFLALFFCTVNLHSQIFQSYNINLLSLSQPNLGDEGVDNRRYSGCWGWHQVSKNKEYGICGASNGTYFIDVSSPTTPTVSGFMPGAQKSTYREMKTYQHYCYIVSDDGQNKNFQIVDMQYLPDSIHVVYNDSTLFRRGHTIWIDKDKMYIGAMIQTLPLAITSMAVYSLANPESPVLLRKLDQDLPLLSYIHDMYVRNDTVFASAGSQGLYILKFDPIMNKFSQLGTYVDYQSHGYNHSSFLTKDGKHLIFCDEVPERLPIHFVNVENLSNIQPIKDWNPTGGNTTPHNPYIRDNFAIVSCYQDGLFIYDISQPSNINTVGYFDTHPQAGQNIGNYMNAPYRGNWGAYPFLPSGIIIANDMQNGMFVLSAASAFTTTIKNPVGIKENTAQESNLIIYPNPASTQIALHYTTQNPSTLYLKNILGQVITEKEFNGSLSEYLDVRSLESGTYFISISEKGNIKTKKLIINH
ncbi:choice-of-anchor B family protein [Aurantibacillus circumpalustris]|uniref:choice-of-anchor B family protein n=1 Tax=Aurantibacillus circumpalustris TaxID=3036359 RepID=UPI00295B99C6|nr:choice-of-anchor B family protein [Aurantibacillus circumpalustris]